ncbi:MAG: LytR C-terminal domain-containing protein [Corynebacterium sp.]|nr:LytR C-terminal domain-containing protein [Corynebacterium sp.]
MTKPEQKPAAEPRLPLRGLAMILLAIAVLFIAWGIFMLSQGSGTPETKTQAAQVSPAASSPAAPQSQAQEQETKKEEQPKNSEEASDTSEAASGNSASTGAAGNEAQAAKERVHILNNSTVQGLGQRVADDVREQKFEVGEIGNHSESTFATSGVYFTSGKSNEEKTARALADALGLTAAPRGPELERAPDGVVLVVTQDLNR